MRFLKKLKKINPQISKRDFFKENLKAITKSKVISF